MDGSFLEIGLSANYVPDWGLWEGIREIIQNAKDREDKTGEKLIAHYSEEKRLLFIVNRNTTLPDEIWTFGFSEKGSLPGKNTKPRGKWGEGLKLGCLALIRQGKKVVILNGERKFIPVIRKSKLHTHPTLQISVSPFRRQIDSFYVIIKDVTLNEWETVQSRFSFLEEKEGLQDKEGNQLFTGSSERGKLYADGIYVETDPELYYGYNLKNVDIPRDRNYIPFWNKASAIGPALANILCENLHNNEGVRLLTNFIKRNVITPDKTLPRDLCGFDQSGPISCLEPYFRGKDKEVLNKLHQLIKVIILEAGLCRTQRETEDLRRFQSKVLLVTKELYSIAKLVGYQNIYENHAAENYKNIEPRKVEKKELTRKQREVFEEATEIVRKAIQGIVYDNEIYIVDFEKKLSGLWREDRVYIDASILDDIGTTIETLVHEFSHQRGPDFTAAHAETIKKITIVVNNILYRRKR